MKYSKTIIHEMNHLVVTEMIKGRVFVKYSQGITMDSFVRHKSDKKG